MPPIRYTGLTASGGRLVSGPEHNKHDRPAGARHSEGGLMLYVTPIGSLSPGKVFWFGNNGALYST